MTRTFPNWLRFLIGAVIGFAVVSMVLVVVVVVAVLVEALLS